MSNTEIAHILDTLQQQHFYGSLEVKLEAGKIVLLRKTETLKPTESASGDNLYRINRGKYGQSQQ